MKNLYITYKSQDIQLVSEIYFDMIQTYIYKETKGENINDDVSYFLRRAWSEGRGLTHLPALLPVL